ncbi:MAG: DUF1501 domain-containing protein [Gammaproteobacteria bacterium]|nr:DUF1501 domain-containing protein [Gammaproteobacteria bacterium]
MKRRDFLRNALGTSALLGLGTASLAPRLANAFVPVGFQKTLINVMLLGGADLRYLFVPEPGSAYANKFWEARNAIYRSNAQNQLKYQTYGDVWNDLYLPTTDANGHRFGIHKRAGWLKQQFDQGHVAVISNVLGSDNRRHDQSQLIVNSGDMQASQYVYDRDGWGGRLAYAISNANAVSVTRDISVFCNGIESGNRNAKVVHANDTRNFGLSNGNANPNSANSKLARALKAYYAAKQRQVAKKRADWPYHKFLQHEAGLRRFGDDFNTRLQTVSPVQPASLQALYTAGSGNMLNSSSFGLQCANIYDSFIGADLFDMRIASMEYTGWDTHNQQKTRFETNIEDIFGTGKGLETLTQELEPLGVNADLVYTFNTDFGRQLRANGDYGTDHGRGNYMILLGRGVNGGVYGEMFPESEISGIAGQTRFDQQGADIEGLTAFDQVLGRVCDWVAPNTGAQVFPDTASGLPMVETGVDLNALFLA